MSIQCTFVVTLHIHVYMYVQCHVQVEEVALKPGGANIDVSETNKREYVRSDKLSQMFRVV